MREMELVVQNATGLHARPAREFVNVAKQFQASIHVHHGDKKANAKSMISVLTLGVESGGTIRIQVDGDDEELALRALETAVINGLGEGHHQLEETPEPATPEAKETHKAANRQTAASDSDKNQIPKDLCEQIRELEKQLKKREPDNVFKQVFEATREKKK